MSSWRPDFLSLRLFVAVCEEASISRAAEREAIVPSAVSKRIAEIEDALGVPLLRRSNRGARPTAAGTAFLHHARQILLSAVRLQGEMADYASGARGHVRIAANVSSILQFLPRDIAAFMTRHPDIRVDLDEQVSPAVAEMVREGQVDMGVGLPMPDAEGLLQLPYERDRLIVLLPARHPLAGRASLAFEETLGCDFVSTQPAAGTTTFLTALAARHGRAMHYRMHVGTLEALCHIVAEGLGIAIVAEGAVRHCRDGAKLRTVPLEDGWAARDIVIHLRAHEPQALAVQQLVRHLQAQAGTRQAG